MVRWFNISCCRFVDRYLSICLVTPKLGHGELTSSGTWIVSWWADIICLVRPKLGHGDLMWCIFLHPNWVIVSWRNLSHLSWVMVTWCNPFCLTWVGSWWTDVILSHLSWVMVTWHNQFCLTWIWSWWTGVICLITPIIVKFHAAVISIAKGVSASQESHSLITDSD